MSPLSIFGVRAGGWRGKWCRHPTRTPEGWGAVDKFTVVLETAAFNATELSAYCRERGLYPEQVSHWRQVAQNANAKPVRTMAEQKDLEKLHAQDQARVPCIVVIPPARPPRRSRGGPRTTGDRLHG
jgi:hypothetical protein